MSEVLIDIENSEIPRISEVQLDPWELRIKKSLTNLVLTPTQQAQSLNSRPYFMVVMTLFRVLVLISFANYLMSKDIQPYDFVPLASEVLAIIAYVISHIFIGIPLEISQGTLKSSIFYLSVFLYTFVFASTYAKTTSFFIYGGPSALSFAGLHLSNIVKNWETMTMKLLRIISLSAIFLVVELFMLFNFSLNIHQFTFGLSGGLLGYLLGYYWIYRTKDEETQEIKWRSAGIISTWLLFFLVLSEFLYLRR